MCNGFMSYKKMKDYAKGVLDKYNVYVKLGAASLVIIGMSLFLDKKEKEYNAFDGPIVDKNVEYSNLLTRIGDNLIGEESKIKLFCVDDNGEKKWIIQDKEIPSGADSARGYFEPTTLKLGDKKIGASNSVEEFH